MLSPAGRELSPRTKKQSSRLRGLPATPKHQRGPYYKYARQNQRRKRGNFGIDSCQNIKVGDICQQKHCRRAVFNSAHLYFAPSETGIRTATSAIESRRVDSTTLPDLKIPSAPIDREKTFPISTPSGKVPASDDVTSNAVFRAWALHQPGRPQPRPLQYGAKSRPCRSI